MAAEPDDVGATLQILLEAVQARIDHVNARGAKAFHASDYASARQAMDQADGMTAFRSHVLDLAEKWREISAPLPSAGQARDSTGERTQRRAGTPTRIGGHLRPGQKTPREAFRAPILISLLEVGGTAPAQRVLDAVSRKMEGILNESDHQGLPSRVGAQGRARGDGVRWRNTARWCRNDLADEGLIRRPPRRGVWELTEAGRREAEALVRQGAMASVRGNGALPES